METGCREDFPSAVASLLVDPVPPRNLRDWSSLDEQRPLCLFLPRSAQDVAAILTACRERGIPVVPQGGLTGLAGGARPIAGAAAISMERMSGVIEVDAASGTITVWAGTPLETVQQAAAEAGLYFAVDLGARGSCAVGGNVSTNAGGNRVIRYGMMREQVLGMEVVLPDGTVLTNLNRFMKNNTGYDLKQLFIGAEGTLGIVTRLVLRLHPLPDSTHAALVAAPGYDAVLRLLADARQRLGPMLSAFEVMWDDYWHIAREICGGPEPFASAHPFYVLLESQGTDAELDGARFERCLEAMFERGSASDAVIARGTADIDRFWGLRDAASEFRGFIGPHMSFDIGLPIPEMDRFAEACRQRLDAAVPGCRSIYYGHIGDGNMHLLSWSPGAATQPETEMAGAVYGLVREFGGSVSAEHGIGLLKKAYLAHSRTPAELALMRAIKRAVDPLGLMNPGKVLDMGEPD